MRAILHIILSLAAATWAVSCTCGRSGDSDFLKPYPGAYQAGTEAADSFLLFAGDEGAMMDCLLDIRSEVYRINGENGDKAAREYERGFRERVTEKNDSLARILF